MYAIFISDLVLLLTLERELLYKQDISKLVLLFLNYLLLHQDVACIIYLIFQISLLTRRKKVSVKCFQQMDDEINVVINSVMNLKHGISQRREYEGISVCSAANYEIEITNIRMDLQQAKNQSAIRISNARGDLLTSQIKKKVVTSKLDAARNIDARQVNFKCLFVAILLSVISRYLKLTSFCRDNIKNSNNFILLLA